MTVLRRCARDFFQEHGHTDAAPVLVAWAELLSGRAEAALRLARAEADRAERTGERLKEVEARIVQHESVAECAVVGHRDADGLEEVVACVVPMPGKAVDGDELIAFCREGLAAFKRPRQVLVLEGLPKTATGKIQRVVVREIAADTLRK